MIHFLSKTFLKKTIEYAKKHKYVSLFTFVFVLSVVYFVYNHFAGSEGETRYILGTVVKDTVVVSVSGSGQVAVSNQIDVKPKVSGDVIWVSVISGQEVRQGAAIAGLDNTDASQAIIDAELAIKEASLNFEKSSAQAPIDYQRKLESLDKSKSDLMVEYKNVFSLISKAFIDLPTVITGSEDVLFGNSVDTRTGQNNLSIYKDLFDQAEKDLVTSLADIAEKDIRLARIRYDESFSSYKTVSTFSSNEVMEKTLDQTLSTAEAIAQATKSEINLLDTVVDILTKKNRKISSVISGYQSNLKSYINTANSHTGNLSSEQSNLQNLKDDIKNLERDITILKINNPTGFKPIDLQISENSIKKLEANLAELKQNLLDYVVRAPFDGVISKILVKKGDSVSSGTNIATIVSKQKIAEITLNEVDVAKVKIGQKAILTFDAIENLSITGNVASIDTVGTVSQGVVNYYVQINFDTQDDRIKPGMSTSVAIITDVKTDVLTVQNSAIKSQNAYFYVEMFEMPIATDVGTQGITSSSLPVQRVVTTGISNDTVSEITSGLSENDQIILRTVVSSIQSGSQTPSIISAVTGRTGTSNFRTSGNIGR